MIKQKYFKESSLRILQESMRSNLFCYEQDGMWISDVLGATHANESGLELISHPILLPADEVSHDLENTKAFYTAYKHLSVSQATNPKLWAYLAHVDYWEYMRSRWPVESKEPQQRLNYVKTHYFHANEASRSLMRHGIARLWWYGYLTHDTGREDPWVLTRKLLEKLDIAQTLLERNLSRSRNVLHAILDFFIQHEERIPSGNKGREFIRSLVKYLNFHGGVSLIDSLSPSDLRETLDQKLTSLL